MRNIILLSEKHRNRFLGGKKLEPGCAGCMFRVPSIHEASETAPRGSSRASEFSVRTGIALVEKLKRNYVDDGDGKILAGSLSHVGRLFEIYFVRLIGTPNQNSKNGISFG
jgi:hypothetical protein